MGVLRALPGAACEKAGAREGAGLMNALQRYQSPARFFLDQAQRVLCRTDLDRDNQASMAFSYVQSAIRALDRTRTVDPGPPFFWLGAAGERSPSAITMPEPPGDGGEVWW